tara:strand:- start:212 stop:1987 length:1776 start_codon:yes stop_codon:yes gene_type:complete
MNNIIELKAPDVEQVAIDNLVTQINSIKQQIEQDKRKIKDDETISINLQILEAGETTKVEKKNLKDQKKAIDANIKLMKTSVNAKESQLNNIEVDLGKIRQKRKQEFVQQNSQNNAEKVFDEHNIHYVIFDQQWWSVDPAGGRMDVKINASEAGVVKDLIFNDSNWEINNEQELKKLAKEMGRMYKHIVRDFDGPRPGVYNQMATIRKQWLQPIHGVIPHDAFRVLTLSIAGGDEDYADQLEKFVAYRYCHPADVMIPNIDSCAIGGTGRDTFYNILRAIFTDECCGSVGTETFKGTHNGDLFGKMLIKVDEKDSHSVPIDKIKELTGSTRYRHRAMNKDARDVARLFSFIFFRNGFTSTARLSGTGTSGEDRRFEPVIARVNLPRHMALYHQLINDINEIPSDETVKAMMILVKDWQRYYYKEETRIAEWLGYIIDKFDAKNMTELLPLHGKYYKEMLTRQKKGIDGFMPKFIALMTQGYSTVINIKDAHKLYEIAESQKCTKDWFKNAMMYWLNTHLGWDSEEIMLDVYTWVGCPNNGRRKMTVVQNKLSVPNKFMFNIDDFIDKDALDDKGTTVGEKINVFSIRDELR